MSDQQLVSKNGRKVTAETVAGSDATHSAPRVLVVDDDPGIRLVMRETLVKAGFNVCDASSGSEAIERCSQFNPDLMLLDINMPSMDGITACAEIRTQCKRDFPIIMVTSVDDAVSIQQAFDAGATDFILKPINWPLFQRRLDSVLIEWNRAREFDASEKRVRLLEKVVPEQVMLVSRSGAIIEDLKNNDETPLTADTGFGSLDDLYGSEIGRRFQQRISGVLKTRRQNQLEFTVNEHGFDRDLEAQFLLDGRDRVIVVVQDVSGDKHTQHEIYDLAFLDSATALPNRHLFERSAAAHLTEARLHDQTLVFLSLTFDSISDEDQSNPDTIGMLADRLKACLHDVNSVIPIGNGDSTGLLARIETNQFVLLLKHRQNSGDISTVCNQIEQSFAVRIASQSGTIKVAPKLGIAMFPADGKNLVGVMHAADTAMNEARRKGKLLCFYSKPAAQPKRDMQDYGDELRQAMDDGQLELYYQPRLSLPDGAVTCVEALLRWNHPMRGFVDLGEVLYLAKATGLIMQLGDWVLQTACEEALRWQSGAIPRVAVNLSQEEFARHDLAQRVTDTLERTGLDPDRIELELTEEALLRTKDSLADLERLKELGVGLVLDDFGTGHSSVASLNQYPIGALKIDATFVRDVIADAKNAAICEVIVSMAHILGMKAVAEGVETQEQQDCLLRLMCDEFQGFHICHPLPAHELEAYLADLTAIM